MRRGIEDRGLIGGIGGGEGTGMCAVRGQCVSVCVRFVRKVGAADTRWWGGDVHGAKGNVGMLCGCYALRCSNCMIRLVN